MMLLPPARFSTITCWLQIGVSLSAKRREMMSGPVPGGCERRNRTGFDGHDWAWQAAEAKSSARASQARVRAAVKSICPPESNLHLVYSAPGHRGREGESMSRRLSWL